MLRILLLESYTKVGVSIFENNSIFLQKVGLRMDDLDKNKHKRTDEQLR